MAKGELKAKLISKKSLKKGDKNGVETIVYEQ
jgi:hypothetical protein